VERAMVPAEQRPVALARRPVPAHVSDYHLHLHTLFSTYTYSLSLYLASLPSLCLAGALYLLMSRVISHAGRGRDRGQKQERGETQPSECIGVLGSRVYGLWPRV